MNNTKDQVIENKITITEKDYYTLTDCFFILQKNDFELNLSKYFTQDIRELHSKIFKHYTRNDHD